MTAAASNHSKPRKQLKPAADRLCGLPAEHASRLRAGSAPDAAREQERQVLSALMDHISDNIYFKDTRSRFTLINRAMADFFNLKHPSEAIGKTDFDFFTADHAAKAFEDEQAMIRTGQPVIGKEEKETWPDGHESWVSSTKMPFRDETGKIIGTFGISRDISAGKRMEAQLRESEARYRAVIQLAPDIIYRMDTKGLFTFVSQAVGAFGYTPAELLGKSLEPLVHPDDVERLRNTVTEHRIGIRAARDIEVRLRRKWSGRRKREVEYVQVAISARGIWNVSDDQIAQPGKLFLGTEGIIHDITDRKKVEAELLKHRERLKELVAERTAELGSANDLLRGEIAERKRMEEALRQERDRAQTYLDIAGTMIVVLDTKGRLALINREGCEILGYAEKKILGRNWFDLVLPVTSAREVKSVFKKIIAGQIGRATYYENPVVTRSSEVRLIAWHNTVLTDKAGRIVGTLSSGQDITDRKRTEEALLQSERLQAIGTMAGGVALSFSNIINTINSHASLIAANFIPETRMHNEARSILAATRHAAELTQRLTGLAKAGGDAAAADAEPVPLGKVIREAMDFMEQTLAEKNIRFHVKGADNMPFVKGHSGQLLDTLIAIFVNAAEAMPSGGSIAIDAEERHVSRSSLKHKPDTKPGRYVILRIRDTGSGISRDVLPRVFEPFFTTKRPGAALGLGLTFAQSALRRMGGWIEIRSREGSGASVRLLMPKAEEARARLLEKQRAEMLKPRAVLLVDDEDESLAFMKAGLEKAGYVVHTARSAEEGISRYRTRPKELALFVVDAMLPKPGSQAVIQEIRKKGPQARIILTSGFSRDCVQALVPLGGWGFLQRPFDARQLVEAVRESIREGLSSGSIPS